MLGQAMGFPVLWHCRRAEQVAEAEHSSSAPLVLVGRVVAVLAATAGFVYKAAAEHRGTVARTDSVGHAVGRVVGRVVGRMVGRMAERMATAASAHTQQPRHR